MRLARRSLAALAVSGFAFLSQPAAGQLAPNETRVTITGVRLTAGDGVACPTIRDDDGVVHTVSYLSPSIPIGARVTVRGYRAAMPSCFADVIVVEEETISE